MISSTRATPAGPTVCLKFSCHLLRFLPSDACKPMWKLLPALSLSFMLHTAAAPLGYHNRPMGSRDHPLVLRSYLPDPGLEVAVFQQHHKASAVPEYNPSLGQDVPGTEIQPIAGLVAAIAVNFGPSLSYVFDTTECRILYAWQGGFLDMSPYWGDPERGSRLSYDYVPRLVGTLFWKTSGKDPVELSGKSLSDLGPRSFIGYRLVQNIPVFEYEVAGTRFSLSLEPSPDPLSCKITLTSTTNEPLSWRGATPTRQASPPTFTLTGSEIARFHGHDSTTLITRASADAGASLFSQLGCAACHSIDGSKSHGPSLANLAGRSIEIEGSKTPVLADAHYLAESIRSPNAKISKGYPANYMPPFTLRDVESDSLVLYIQSLTKPH
jgi:cytochrome c551/c552